MIWISFGTSPSYFTDILSWYKPEYRSIFFTQKFAQKSPLNLYTDNWHNASCHLATGQPIRPIQTRKAPSSPTSIGSTAIVFFDASLTVSERMHAIPLLLKTSPGTPGQFPTASKRNTIQYAQANGNVSGERQFSTEKIAPYWEGAALAMQRSEDCLVDAVLCT